MELELGNDRCGSEAKGVVRPPNRDCFSRKERKWKMEETKKVGEGGYS
jgi:hypothetical protein